jgi:hypothetical protein
MSSSYNYSSSHNEWDLEEEENIAMILALHSNKRPKHEGEDLDFHNAHAATGSGMRFSRGRA